MINILISPDCSAFPFILSLFLIMIGQCPKLFLPFSVVFLLLLSCCAANGDPRELGRLESPQQVSEICSFYFLQSNIRNIDIRLMTKECLVILVKI